MSGAVTASAVLAPVYSIPADVTDVSAPNASATVTFESDGDLTSVTISGGTADIGDWVSPKILNSGHTIRAHVVSGSLDASSSAVDSDLALSSNRSWLVTQSGSGTAQCVLTFTLKNAAGVTVASGNVTLTAQVP